MRLGAGWAPALIDHRDSLCKERNDHPLARTAKALVHFSIGPDPEPGRCGLLVVRHGWSGRKVQFREGCRAIEGGPELPSEGKVTAWPGARSLSGRPGRQRSVMVCQRFT